MHRMYGKHSNVKPCATITICASTHRHHGQFQKPLYGKLWIGSNVVLHRARLGMRRSAKNNKCEFRTAHRPNHVPNGGKWYLQWNKYDHEKLCESQQ